MERSEALRKIRELKPVAQSDLQDLINDVLLHDPDLHLEELVVHFPNKAKRLDLAIRRIVGLEAAQVDGHFRVFVSKYPQLNANQIRFFELLKSYIGRYGAIEVEKLWDEPFTNVHAGGVEGVFTKSEQVDDLLSLLEELNREVA